MARQIRPAACRHDRLVWPVRVKQPWPELLPGGFWDTEHARLWLHQCPFHTWPHVEWLSRAHESCLQAMPCLALLMSSASMCLRRPCRYSNLGVVQSGLFACYTGAPLVAFNGARVGAL